LALSAHVPDFGALEVLVGVARVGSLNNAAQQIGVS
jgi:molybdenum-dependent DNA-binding transcriptional regulator ModE